MWKAIKSTLGGHTHVRYHLMMFGLAAYAVYKLTQIERRLR